MFHMLLTYAKFGVKLNKQIMNGDEYKDDEIMDQIIG